jgi:hypothetical protein
VSESEVVDGNGLKAPGALGPVFPNLFLLRSETDACIVALVSGFRTWDWGVEVG